MAHLDVTIAQLDTSFKTLRQRWDETKKVWIDPVQREFEKTYWAPLEGQLQATQREMERLAQVIAQAQK